MDTAIISAASALAGSVFGGLASGLTTWISLRAQARAGHRLHRIAQREELYRDFIAAASATYGSAILTSEPGIQDVVVLYGMVSRMRVLSSAPVVASAEATMRAIIDAFFAPNKTMAEIHALMKSGAAIDPLRHFSDSARDELNSFG
jgi:hypothetical protein